MEESVVITGSRLRRSENSDEQGISSSISINKWSPDRPYLKAIKDKCTNSFMEIYFAQRKEHGSIPSFYLEMSDAAKDCNLYKEAKSIALSALELPTSNDDTLSAVAQRLLRLKEYKTAIDLLEKYAHRAPIYPQPWRELALALAQQANEETSLSKKEKHALYREALKHLNHIIQTPWDDAYDGIEIISLIEANNILKKFKKAGGNNQIIKDTLTGDLKFDLRVTASWNVDNVDMDLWVDEPTGERSIYSNPLTLLGGALSNDMTEGYGPEQYLLKKAIRGDYNIKMNYYASDIVNPNGAVVLRVDVFRNWGRKNEKQETVFLEFTEQKNDNEHDVANIKVD